MSGDGQRVRTTDRDGNIVDVTNRESTLDKAIRRLRQGAKNEHVLLVGIQMEPDECAAVLKALGLRVEP